MRCQDYESIFHTFLGNHNLGIQDAAGMWHLEANLSFWDLCLVGVSGRRESLHLNPSRQYGIKCFFGKLFEIDDMDRAEIKLSMAGRGKKTVGR